MPQFLRNNYSCEPSLDLLASSYLNITNLQLLHRYASMLDKDQPSGTIFFPPPKCFADILRRSFQAICLAVMKPLSILEPHKGQTSITAFSSVLSASFNFSHLPLVLFLFLRLVLGGDMPLKELPLALTH